MSKESKWEKDGDNWTAKKAGSDDFVQLEALSTPNGATNWRIAFNGDCSDTHTPDLKRAKRTAVRWLLGRLQPPELA